MLKVLLALHNTAELIVSKLVPVQGIRRTCVEQPTSSDSEARVLIHSRYRQGQQGNISQQEKKQLASKLATVASFSHQSRSQESNKTVQCRW